MTISVEPTRELEIVKDILTDPRVYSRMADDFAPAPKNLTLPEFRGVDYLVVRLRNVPVGAFVVIARSPVQCEAHFCFLPEAWGGAAREAAFQFLAWLWKNTSFQRVIGNIPSDNRLALHFAKEFGFKAFGRNPRSFQKHGKLIDEIWVGISRPPQAPTT